jgi:hypothetical protein
LLGGGSFHVDPGQVTDDTEMAMALTRYTHTRTFDVTHSLCTGACSVTGIAIHSRRRQKHTQTGFTPIRQT